MTTTQNPNVQPARRHGMEVTRETPGCVYVRLHDGSEQKLIRLSRIDGSENVIVRDGRAYAAPPCVVETGGNRDHPTRVAIRRPTRRALAPLPVPLPPPTPTACPCAAVMARLEAKLDRVLAECAAWND